jgi:hypothetical protein
MEAASSFLASSPAGTRVICTHGGEYKGWTPKKGKFTRRESSMTNCRARRLAEAEEKRKKDGI